MTAPPRPRLILLYHFFHPDDVVSARQFSDLAEGMAARGWDVVARPANRTWRGEPAALQLREQWGAVDVRRVWRLPLRQASNVGRVINALWMLAAWTWIGAFGSRQPREVVVIGSDPLFAVLAALPWRLFRPRAKVIHWCFDLYPDAAVAEGVTSADSRIVRWLRRLTAAAYRRCEFIADLGPCMALRLHAMVPEVRCRTLTPWALVEPNSPPLSDPATRAELCGDASLGLLYSGSFGRAHSYVEFLELARLLRGDAEESGVAFCFAGRGHRADELRSAVTPADANIRFAGFAPEAELERRLAACDLHLVSLRADYTGTVVPSKFFGALATGRGVVFAGSPESSIAQWICEHRVGWVLTPETLTAVAADLRALAAAPEQLQALRQRCHRVYHECFSKQCIVDQWDAELRQSIGLEAIPADRTAAVSSQSLPTGSPRPAPTLS